MKTSNAVLLGLILGLLGTSASLGMYKLGVSDGKYEVIYTCNDYQKYKFDGTQELLCSAIIEPAKLDPDPQLIKEFYSKENKDAHKKDRK